MWFNTVIEFSESKHGYMAVAVSWGYVDWILDSM